LSNYRKEPFEFHKSLKNFKGQDYLKNIFIDDNEEHLFKARNTYVF